MRPDRERVWMSLARGLKVRKFRECVDQQQREARWQGQEWGRKR
ncbi:MAG TPA: hypothetical protein VIM12_13495 [Noviherbaspirillum sp.]